MTGKLLLIWALVGCLLILGWTSFAEAGSATLTWNKGPESDLAGTKVYMREEGAAYGAPISVIPGKDIVTALVNVPDQPLAHKVYFTISFYDTSENESTLSNEVNKLFAGTVVVLPKPGLIALTVVPTGQNSVRITWPFVDDGTGKAASVNIRQAVGLISWGTAASTSCTVSPCDVVGLLTDTAYQFQGVGYRAGTPNIFGVVAPAVSVRTLKDTTPPPPPTGLTITKNTTDQVIVVAQAADCRQVAVDQTASTVDQHQLKLNCIR